MSIRKVVMVVGISLIAGALLTGCPGTTQTTNDTGTKSRETQERVAGRAMAVVPAYQPEKFSVRKAVNEWSKQMDTSSEWYIYVTNMNGEYTGYYVASSPPVNYCMLMTPPDRIRRFKNVDLAGGYGDVFVKESAPNLDGVYSGGGGASCMLWFWIDAATGGMVGTVASTANLQFTNVMFNIDVPKIETVPNEK